MSDLYLYPICCRVQLTTLLAGDSKMAEIVPFTLRSTPMIYMPGILATAKKMYHVERDRMYFGNIFKAYGLSDKCVDDLISGRIQAEIVDESVCFAYDESGYEPVLTDRRTLEEYLKSKSGQPFTGYIDDRSIEEGGDLRITLKFADEMVDIDLQGDEAILVQIQPWKD